MPSITKLSGRLALLTGTLLVLATTASISTAVASDGDPRMVSPQAQGPLFPWVGEELYFTIRVNGAEAMRAGLRIGDIQNRERRPYIPINAMARSRGFLDAIYSIDDRANTFLDPTTSHPFRSEKVFNENGKYRRYDVDYRHSSYLADVERHREERQSTFQSPIPDRTHDMLTWIYELRQTDDLSMGDEFSFYVYDGWLLSRLELEVVGREDILTPMGWFKTWKLKFTRKILNTDISESDDENGAPKPPKLSKKETRHTGHLWLSRDANLLPVQVTIDTIMGAGVAMLIRYVPGQAK